MNIHINLGQNMIVEQGIRLVTTQIHICLHDDNQTSNLRTKQNFD